MNDATPLPQDAALDTAVEPRVAASPGEPSPAAPTFASTEPSQVDVEPLFAVAMEPPPSVESLPAVESSTDAPAPGTEFQPVVPPDSPGSLEVAPEGLETHIAPDAIETPLTVPSSPSVLEPRPSAWLRAGHELWAAAQTLLSAAVYATLIVTFGFQVARVDGLSMAPTLEDHDRLIVNKLVYEMGDPRPGDIVMLYYPLNPEKMFVKRVIAKEGDVVRIVDGRVFVNDVPLKDDYVAEEFRSHDDYGPTVIREGYYFVMGDHRNNSSDSRHWGEVPKKYIVGKVKIRWWPIQDARVF